VGGLLIEAFGETNGWRSIFFVNLPFGLIGVIAALKLLPRTREPNAVRGVDHLGLLLLAGSLVAILVPLIQGQDAGWPLWTWLSLFGGIVLLGLFAAWEVFFDRRGRAPLVPPRLFTHVQFTGGVILALVYFAAFTSIFFALSIMWQAGLGNSALSAGLVGIPFAVGSIIGASQSDRLARRLGRTVLIIGTGMVVIGLAWVWLVLATATGASLTGWQLLAPLLIAGLGSGAFIAPNAQFIIATVSRADAGGAAGVVSTAQRIGAAIGIAVVSSVLFGSISHQLGGGSAPAGATGPPPPFVQNAFVSASAHAIAVSASLALVAFLLVFVLPKRVDLH
jgi:MFS family permease